MSSFIGSISGSGAAGFSIYARRYDDTNENTPNFQNDKESNHHSGKSHSGPSQKAAREK